MIDLTASMSASAMRERSMELESLMMDCEIVIADEDGSRGGREVVEAMLGVVVVGEIVVAFAVAVDVDVELKSIDPSP